MVFADDPAAMAAHWLEQGARRLHLVDLDGAKSGRPCNLDTVRTIVDRVNIPCQLGGGIRDDASVDACFQRGIDRIVIGTQALREPDWFSSLVEKHPGRIALGLDARDGKVASNGWLALSAVDALSLAQQFDHLPLAALIYTDIPRDGMLNGPDLESTTRIAQQLRTGVIASGGVGSLDDVRALARLPISGCIVGRALYECRFMLRDALQAAREVCEDVQIMKA